MPPGSGLSSSAAFEVLIGRILNELFFDRRLSATEIACIGRYAENAYFGKPCGLMVNTVGVLFDQLGKTGSREAVTAAGDYLSGALYGLLRQLYRRGGGNEDFFAVSPGDYDGGLVQADMTMSQVRYRRALSQAEEVQEITPDTLTAGYPGLGQSVAQVIHNTDERCKSLQ